MGGTRLGVPVSMCTMWTVLVSGWSTRILVLSVGLGFYRIVEASGVGTFICFFFGLFDVSIEECMILLASLSVSVG